MKNRDPEKLRFALRRTIFYELWMLSETYSRLLQPVPDVVVRNALIESFCVHARQLLEFFENKQGIRACEFTGGTYIEVHTAGIDKVLRKKLDQQITHITEKRTDVPSEKIVGPDRAVLLHCILQEAAHFAKQVEPDFQGLISVEYKFAEGVRPSNVPVSENCIGSVIVEIAHANDAPT